MTRRPAPGILSAMRTLIALVLVGLAMAAGAASVPDPDLPIATGTGRLEVSAEVERLRVRDRRDGPASAEFVPAGRVRAGEELHYTLRVRNPGTQAVREVQVTKRLPFGVRYVDGSAVGPATRAEFSADGGTRFGVASALRVTPPGAGERRAEAGDYTHVRWVLLRPLEPGATALLRFRAHFE